MVAQRVSSRPLHAAGAIAVSLAAMLVLAAGSEAVFGTSICHNVLANFNISQIRLRPWALWRSVGDTTNALSHDKHCCTRAGQCSGIKSLLRG
jgi:hypothetical protein